MAASRRSIPRTTKSVSKKQKPKPATIQSKPKRGAPVQAAPPMLPPAEALKKTIAYFFLLSYCPPQRIAEWESSLSAMRKTLAGSAALSEAAYFKMASPEVFRRIVAFHEASREPSTEWIETLVDAASEATKSPRRASAFQEQMSKVAQLPQRAAPEGRLHRKKGCQFCGAPCTYGYFTLVSDPQFRMLQDLFAAEAAKPAAQQSPLNACMEFTVQHLRGLAGIGEEFIERRHLVNLSYCLLMLSMAKSRMPLPEKQLRVFQAANQAFIREGAY